MPLYVDQEEWVKQVTFAKRRVMEAAGATSGRIGDPGEFLLALIKHAQLHGMEEEAKLLRQDWEANWSSH